MFLYLFIYFLQRGLSTSSNGVQIDISETEDFKSRTFLNLSNSACNLIPKTSQGVRQIQGIGVDTCSDSSVTISLFAKIEEINSFSEDSDPCASSVKVLANVELRVTQVGKGVRVTTSAPCVNCPEGIIYIKLLEKPDCTPFALFLFRSFVSSIGLGNQPCTVGSDVSFTETSLSNGCNNLVLGRINPFQGFGINSLSFPDYESPYKAQLYPTIDCTGPLTLEFPS